MRSARIIHMVSCHAEGEVGNVIVGGVATALGFEIKPDEASDLAATGTRITRAANEQLGFEHPANPDWTHISFCEFALPLSIENGVRVSKNSVVIDPGKLDRSPNGAVVMPAYGVPSDERVHSFLTNLFADRQVALVNINAIAPAGGGIHCITQQQPA